MEIKINEEVILEKLDRLNEKWEESERCTVKISDNLRKVELMVVELKTKMDTNKEYNIRSITVIGIVLASLTLIINLIFKFI